MAFIADRTALRTYDPERGYELFKRGGGSDGGMDFELVGPDERFFFSAELRFREITADEAALHPNGPSRAEYWVTSGSHDERRAQLIREAMRAYKAVHGNSTGMPYEWQVR